MITAALLARAASSCSGANRDLLATVCGLFRITAQLPTDPAHTRGTGRGPAALSAQLSSQALTTAQPSLQGTWPVHQRFRRVTDESRGTSAAFPAAVRHISQSRLAAAAKKGNFDPRVWIYMAKRKKKRQVQAAEQAARERRARRDGSAASRPVTQWVMVPVPQTSQQPAPTADTPVQPAATPPAADSAVTADTPEAAQLSSTHAQGDPPAGQAPTSTTPPPPCSTPKRKRTKTAATRSTQQTREQPPAAVSAAGAVLAVGPNAAADVSGTQTDQAGPRPTSSEGRPRQLKPAQGISRSTKVWPMTEREVATQLSRVKTLQGMARLLHPLLLARQASEAAQHTDHTTHSTHTQDQGERGSGSGGSEGPEGAHTSGASVTHEGGATQGDLQDVSQQSLPELGSELQLGMAGRAFHAALQRDGGLTVRSLTAAFHQLAYLAHTDTHTTRQRDTQAEREGRRATGAVVAAMPAEQLQLARRLHAVLCGELCALGSQLDMTGAAVIARALGRLRHVDRPPTQAWSALTTRVLSHVGGSGDRGEEHTHGVREGRGRDRDGSRGRQRGWSTGSDTGAQAATLLSTATSDELLYMTLGTAALDLGPPILWRAITQCFVSLAYSGVYLGEEGAQQLYATLNAMTRGRSGSGRRVHQRMSESVSESERVTQISEGEGDTLGHALLVALPYLGRERGERCLRRLRELGYEPPVRLHRAVAMTDE